MQCVVEAANYIEPTPIQELNPEVDYNIIAIVEKAMQKIIYDRYESAYLLARDLSNSFGRLRGVGERIDMQEKWKTLRYLAFFKDFSDEQITEVVNASEWKEFEKGEVIVTEGEQETAFYIIAKGGVEVVKNENVVGMMKQGDCFGEIAFLTRQPRNATIVARTEVSLMSVSTSLMEQASTETQLRYYRIFLENLIARLSQATDKLVEAGKATPDP